MRPDCFANVATRIANSVLPGHGSGQRISCSPYSAARRSISAIPSSRRSVSAHDPRSKRLNSPPSRIGCHSGGSPPASAKSRLTRSAARYAYGEPEVEVEDGPADRYWWIAQPSTARAASGTASEIVGWGWMIRAMSW